MPLFAIAALAAAYNPFTPRNTPTAAPTRYPQDPRFVGSIYKSDEGPTVQDRMDSVNLRRPNMEASEVHVVVEYSPTLAFIPVQDLEFWLTAAATIPDETVQFFAEGETTNTLPPGICPRLYEYIPQKCKLTVINPEFADKVLTPDKSSIPDDFGPMGIEASAMSRDCHLLVFTTLGHS